MRRLRVARGVVVILAVILSGLYWAATIQHDRVRVQLQAVRAQHLRPVPIAGLRLSLAGTEAVRLDDVSDATTASAARTLLLVVSDDCPACVSMVPRWRDLVQRIGLQTDDEVVVVSYSGTHIAQELAPNVRATGVRFRVLRIAERERFQLSTGIIRTPTTVLLDAQSRIRYLTSALDGAAATHLQSVFKGLSETPSMTRNNSVVVQ